MRTRQTAMTIAILGFFVLAGVGWFRGSSMYACATRGLVGAAVLFVLVRLVNRVLVRIVADTIIRSASRQSGRKGGQQGTGSE